MICPRCGLDFAPVLAKPVPLPGLCRTCYLEWLKENPVPIIEPIMQFFSYAHLPEHLAPVSKPFAELAEKLVTELPRNAERTVALRKLLEAKDAAVRAKLYKDTI